MRSEFFENGQERWDAISKLKYDVAKYLKIKPNSKILEKFGEFINNYGTLVRESHVIVSIGKKL